MTQEMIVTMWIVDTEHGPDIVTKEAGSYEEAAAYARELNQADPSNDASVETLYVCDCGSIMGEDWNGDPACTNPGCSHYLWAENDYKWLSEMDDYTAYAIDCHDMAHGF